MSLERECHAALQGAVATALGPDFAEEDPLLRPAQRARFGDLQANLAMSLAKRLGRKPRSGIARPASRVGHDDAQRPRGKVIGVEAACHKHQRAGRKSTYDKARHPFLPLSGNRTVLAQC